MIDIKCSFKQKIYWMFTKKINQYENQSFKSDIHDLKQWDAIWLDYSQDQ